jgi:hypothetical protein
MDALNQLNLESTYEKPNEHILAADADDIAYCLRLHCERKREHEQAAEPAINLNSIEPCRR